MNEKGIRLCWLAMRHHKKLVCITAKLKIQKGNLLSIFCTVNFPVSFSKMNAVQHG